MCVSSAVDTDKRWEASSARQSAPGARLFWRGLCRRCRLLLCLLLGFHLGLCCLCDDATTTRSEQNTTTMQLYRSTSPCCSDDPDRRSRAVSCSVVCIQPGSTLGLVTRRKASATLVPLSMGSSGSFRILHQCGTGQRHMLHEQRRCQQDSGRPGYLGTLRHALRTGKPPTSCATWPHGL